MAIGDPPPTIYANTQEVRCYFTDQALPSQITTPFTDGIVFSRPTPEIVADINDFMKYCPALQDQFSPSSDAYSADSAWLPMPDVKINQFFYPCGLQRFGVFRGVLTGEEWIQFQIRFLQGGPTQSDLPAQWGWFVIERIDNTSPSGSSTPSAAYGSPMVGYDQNANNPPPHRIATPMRPLVPIPWTSLDGTQSGYIITLVDERYFWQDVAFADATDNPVNPNTGMPSGFNLITNQYNAIKFNPNSTIGLTEPSPTGIGTTLTGGVPETNSLGSGSGNPCYVNTALLNQPGFEVNWSTYVPFMHRASGRDFDALYAHSGQVGVRDWYGNVRTDTYRKANNDAFNNHTANSIYSFRGGRLYQSAVGQITNDMWAQLPQQVLYTCGRCFMTDDPNSPGGVIAYNPSIPANNEYGLRFNRRQFLYNLYSGLGPPYCQMTTQDSMRPVGILTITDTILAVELVGGESSTVVAAANANNAVVDTLARVTIGNYLESLLTPIEGSYRGIVYWEPDGATDLLYDLSTDHILTRVFRRPRAYCRREYYRNLLDLTQLVSTGGSGGGSGGSGSVNTIIYTFPICIDCNGTENCYTANVYNNGLVTLS